jgi:hypothetical protein
MNVMSFIGTTEYLNHKNKRFHGADKDIPLPEHPALLLPDFEIRKSFIQRYRESAHLYYKGQPDFEIILALIKENIHKFKNCYRIGRRMASEFLKKMVRESFFDPFCLSNVGLGILSGERGSMYRPLVFPV